VQSRKDTLTADESLDPCLTREVSYSTQISTINSSNSLYSYGNPLIGSICKDSCSHIPMMSQLQF
jgi:hypothetical protein